MSFADWTPIDLIYAKCPQCSRHMTWKVKFRSHLLGATCCGYIYIAEPDIDVKMFRVTARHADQTNVINFPALYDGPIKA